MDRLTPSVLSTLRALPAALRDKILAIIRRPPVTSSGSEQFWEHSVYLNAPGNLDIMDCTFGKSWTTKPTQLYSMWGEGGDYTNKSIFSTEWGAWGDVGLAQAVLNLFGPPQINIFLENCAWLAKAHPNNTPSSMRWGIRGFGIMDLILSRCAFSRGMGAGIQVALRAWEPHGDIPPAGTHTFQNCYFIGIGDPKSERWGAFTISEHAPEGYATEQVPVDVNILDCTMMGGHVSWVDPNGNLVNSPRGVLVQGRRKVIINNLHMDYPKPHDGWAMQIWDCAEVEIHNSYIREGRIELRNCGKVTITGCTGDAYVVVGTHKNKAKPFPMETVLYQGSISTPYSK